MNNIDRQRIKMKGCYQSLVKHKLWASTPGEIISNFRRWSLVNHPDKGGNREQFALMSDCVDYVKDNFNDFKRVIQSKTPRPKKPCVPPKVINPKTRRCGAPKKPCLPPQYVNPKTGRCMGPKKPKAPKVPKPPKEKKPCLPTQQRNPKTGRCVNLVKTKAPRRPKVSGVPGAPKKSKSAEMRAKSYDLLNKLYEERGAYDEMARKVALTKEQMKKYKQLKKKIINAQNLPKIFQVKKLKKEYDAIIAKINKNIPIDPKDYRRLSLLREEWEILENRMRH